jgi:hypothetical protein
MMSTVDGASYTAPVITDYGDLLQITAATGFFGTEDGGTKMLPNHHNPSGPAGP